MSEQIVLENRGKRMISKEQKFKSTFSLDAEEDEDDTESFGTDEDTDSGTSSDEDS